MILKKRIDLMLDSESILKLHPGWSAEHSMHDIQLFSRPLWNPTVASIPFLNFKVQIASKLLNMYYSLVEAVSANHFFA